MYIIVYYKFNDLTYISNMLFSFILLKEYHIMETRFTFLLNILLVKMIIILKTKM